MSQANLAIYLNDHIAGSVVALQLLERLENLHRDTGLESLLTGIRLEILADRQDLEALMTKWDIPPSPPRKMFAWISEKLLEAKFSFDDDAAGSLSLLEALEGISLGIEGKRSLWRSLIAIFKDGPILDDFHRLEARAVKQRERIESARLDAARMALHNVPL